MAGLYFHAKNYNKKGCYKRTNYFLLIFRGNIGLYHDYASHIKEAKTNN